ncbi:TRAP transporter small permease [Lacisediminimonas profundi]|uniref:TRAP transporter small permease n=1 Tax=Lacisediminimonas profundi TaxID=2603856 RepID=UPI001F4F1306|nr:TRAP transporter small permease subunit [Lacisediminimonas profundi]
MSTSDGKRTWTERFDASLSHVENNVILASYVTLIILIGVETIRRAVTREQAVWGPEVALHAFVWLSWFSMAKHGRYGTHLAFSELRRRLSEKAQRILEAIDCGIWLGIGTIIIFSSYGIVRNNIAMNQTVFGTPIPLAFATLAVPVGWGFSMLRICQRLWLVFYGWDRLKEEAKNAPGSIL